jgi:DNA-binding NtrC family response regulator
VTLGSDERNHLVIAHPTVSRFHARIDLAPAGYLLTDLHSTNGTSIGATRVEAGYLEHGAQIRLGDVAVKLEVESERAQLALAEGNRFGSLWGGSAPMRRLFRELEQVAASDSPVLIQGETGSGKELVALEIHQHSARRDGPYHVVDCGGLPESLIEAELFGHERGAFTGAVSARAGALEEAHGGTLFLDEIGEVPLALQAKLLRVIESRAVKRLGSDEWRHFDVRVIAATHRDLARMRNQSLFRDDLYFRLAVLTVRVPPLRERPEDIPLLIGAMLNEAGAPGSLAVDRALEERLRARHWAGNVRELRNLVERAIVLGENAFTEENVAPSRAPATSSSLEPFKIAKAQSVLEFERRYLTELLERTQGNVTQAARAAEVDPTSLFRLIKRHRLDLAKLRR